jgi:hypothetical protein
VRRSPSPSAKCKGPQIVSLDLTTSAGSQGLGFGHSEALCFLHYRAGMPDVHKGKFAALLFIA